MRTILIKYLTVFLLLQTTQLVFSKSSKSSISDKEIKENSATINSQCKGDYCDFSTITRDFLLSVTNPSHTNYDELYLIELVGMNLKEAELTLYKIKKSSVSTKESIDMLVKSALNGSFEAQYILAKKLWEEPKGIVLPSLSGKVAATIWARMNHHRTEDNEILTEYYKKKLSRKDYKKTREFIYILKNMIAKNITKNVSIRAQLEDIFIERIKLTSKSNTVKIEKSKINPVSKVNSDKVSKVIATEVEKRPNRTNTDKVTDIRHDWPQRDIYALKLTPESDITNVFIENIDGSVVENWGNGRICYSPGTDNEIYRSAIFNQFPHMKKAIQATMYNPRKNFRHDYDNYTNKKSLSYLINVIFHKAFVKGPKYVFSNITNYSNNLNKLFLRERRLFEEYSKYVSAYFHAYRDSSYIRNSEPRYTYFWADEKACDALIVTSSELTLLVIEQIINDSQRGDWNKYIKGQYIGLVPRKSSSVRSPSIFYKSFDDVLLDAHTMWETDFTTIILYQGDNSGKKIKISKLINESDVDKASKELSKSRDEKNKVMREKINHGIGYALMFLNGNGSGKDTCYTQNVGDDYVVNLFNQRIGIKRIGNIAAFSNINEIFKKHLKDNNYCRSILSDSKSINQYRDALKRKGYDIKNNILWWFSKEAIEYLQKLATSLKQQEIKDKESQNEVMCTTYKDSIGNQCLRGSDKACLALSYLQQRCKS